MVTQDLDPRRREVLKALIQLHISTGEPVGSETVSTAFSRSLSPATIRNIMADLEKLGYLDHPHTSAGRVPTDDGYRVYVDSLMSPLTLRPSERTVVETELRSSDGSPNQLLETASRVLSRLSRNVAFVVAPDIARSNFRQVDFVRLPYPRVLVVTVSQEGLVTSKVIEIEEGLGQDELQACANYLNAHFAGMSLMAIRTRLLALMGEEKALYDSLLQRVVALGRRAFATDEAGGRVYLDGASHMLDKPEFEDLVKMRALFKTFEEKSRLVRILNACIRSSGVRIIIGHENPDPDLQNLALVTLGYPPGGDPSWGLGVLGSTRMEYARSVALVEHVARAVARGLSEVS